MHQNQDLLDAYDTANAAVVDNLEKLRAILNNPDFHKAVEESAEQCFFEDFDAYVTSLPNCFTS